MPWHGLDKILRMAALFPRWSFDLVGTNAAEIQSGVPSNVKVWGHLACPEYLPLMANADCAIGTLALHRNGINEASPLKTREYLALGLPVIIGYKDTDFPQGAEFLLELPNTEDNVLAYHGRIRSFVESWRGRRVSREYIRHLDLDEKERERLHFFRQVIQG
jgi:hypothetical protein